MLFMAVRPILPRFPANPPPLPQVADIGTLRGTTGAVFQVTNCQMYGGYGGAPADPAAGTRQGPMSNMGFQRRAGAHMSRDGRVSMSQCRFSGIYSSQMHLLSS